MDTENGSGRFGSTAQKETVMRYMYEHGITQENWRDHIGELSRFFPSEEACLNGLKGSFSPDVLLSWKKYLKGEQHLDLFPHPRYIQQQYHLHDFFEAKYQLEGSGTVYAGGETFYLRQSDVFLIPPYVSHRNEVYTEDARMINIVLPGDYLEILFPRLMGFPNPLEHFFTVCRSEPQPFSGNRFLHIRTDRDPEIRKIVEESLAYVSNPEGRTRLKEMQTEAAVERLFLLLLDYVSDRSAVPEGKDREAVGKTVRYISSHLRDVKLEDVADLLHYSPSYTSRFIRSRTGYSFQMLLLILRMEEASRMLRETDLAVEQIAAQVGMTGKTHFYTRFRAMFGRNPGEYRSSFR